MRNSLHSNGAANKDINAFDIGQIRFNAAKKDEQFTSMAMHQIIALMVITTYTLELIIEKISKIKVINGVSVPNVIMINMWKKKESLEN